MKLWSFGGIVSQRKKVPKPGERELVAPDWSRTGRQHCAMLAGQWLCRHP